MAKFKKDLCDSNKQNTKSIPKDAIIRYLDPSSITNGIISEFQNLLLSEAPSRAQRTLEENTIVYS